MKCSRPLDSGGRRVRGHEQRSSVQTALLRDGDEGSEHKGETQTLLGELVAVREELDERQKERFTVVPADVLLDLPAHPAAPENLEPEDATLAADFLKSTYQTRAPCRVSAGAATFCSGVSRLPAAVVQCSYSRCARSSYELEGTRGNAIPMSRSRASVPRTISPIWSRTRTERLARLQRLTLASTAQSATLLLH